MLPEVDYTYYEQTYGGDLDEQTFNRAVTRASVRLSSLITSDVPDRYCEAVKMALCALCDYVVKTSRNEGIVSSERAGDVSVSYSVTSATATDDADVVSDYLNGTGLLCTGIRDGGYR